MIQVRSEEDLCPNGTHYIQIGIERLAREEEYVEAALKLCHVAQSRVVPEDVLLETVLSGGNLFGLEAFRPPIYHKGDVHAFFQRAITARFDRGKVHKHILPVAPCDEAVSFTGIEPLYGSCLFHMYPSSFEQ